MLFQPAYVCSALSQASARTTAKQASVQSAIAANSLMIVTAAAASLCRATKTLQPLSSRDRKNTIANFLPYASATLRALLLLLNRLSCRQRVSSASASLPMATAIAQRASLTPTAAISLILSSARLTAESAPQPSRTGLPIWTGLSGSQGDRTQAPRALHVAAQLVAMPAAAVLDVASINASPATTYATIVSADCDCISSF